MPVVHNCRATPCSVWGRPVSRDGFADGPEAWIDELAPGGVGDFPRHRAIVVRESGQDKGPRIAGPSDEEHIYVGGTVPVPSPRLWGGAMLLLLLLLLGLLVMVGIRR
jgi:hypothetical protein